MVRRHVTERAGRTAQHHRMRHDVVRAEKHALEDRPINDASSREGELLAASQIFCSEHLLYILNTRLANGLFIGLVFSHEAAEHFTAKNFYRGGRKHCFGTSATTHEHIETAL